MKERTTIASLILVLIIVVLFIILVSTNATFTKKNGKEYPLKYVDLKDNNEYLICRVQSTAERIVFEVVTDTRQIKENKESFFIDHNAYDIEAFSRYYTVYKNKKEIYFVSNNNKDGVRKEEIGSLKFYEVNEMQYMLLTGSVLIEEDDNYTIIYDDRNKEYILYVNQGNKQDLRTVQRVTQKKVLSNIELRYLDKDTLEIVVYHDVENAKVKGILHLIEIYKIPDNTIETIYFRLLGTND